MRHKKINRLEGLEKITTFLKLVFASANIKGEKPLSALIVAPVSNGKTTSIRQFAAKNPSIMISTDLTAYGILKNHEHDLRDGKIRHIVIPDLLNITKKRKTTADQFIMFVNASAEDGIFPSRTYAIDIKQYIPPIGWVMCITKEAFESKKNFLENIGFVSRFFIVSYAYDSGTIEHILDNIVNEVNVKIPDIKLPSPIKKHIKGNKEITLRLKLLAKVLVKQGDDAGIIRQLKKLIILAKASAYLRNDDHINITDYENIEEIIDLFREYEK